MRQKTPKYARTVKTFQFTHPGGVRLIKTLGAGYAIQFQFTHPGGVRRAPVVLGCLRPYVSIHAPGRGATLPITKVSQDRWSFNSRTREGCDRGGITPKGGIIGFNSRTREGCDYVGATSRSSHPSFNSRTREGCDMALTIASPPVRCFNSRTREGCDARRERQYAQLRQGFNSRTREGCDFIGCKHPYISASFNSRTREGCDLT